MRGLLFFMLIFTVFMLGPLLFGRAKPHTDFEVQGMLAGVVLAMTTFFLPTIVTCDFRGDIDRLDVLKSLPVAPSRLVVGQLVAPVLFGALWLRLSAVRFAAPV